MNIAYFASDKIALESIDMLKTKGFLKCVVSNPDRPKGRGHKLLPNDVSKWACDNEVLLFRPSNGPDDDLIAKFDELKIDTIIVMAYGYILKDNILNYTKNPILNLHGSILPEYRGASPIQTSLALCDKQSGLSLMKIVKKMDAGAVADVEYVDIQDYDTSATLWEKFAISAKLLLERNLESIDQGTLNFVEQDEAKATYTRKLDKDDMRLDFNLSATELSARIRAFGGGLFEYEALTFKIGESKVISDLEFNTNTKQIGEFFEKDSKLYISCKEGYLEILNIQKPCAKMLNTADFLKSFTLNHRSILNFKENRALIRTQ